MLHSNVGQDSNKGNPSFATAFVEKEIKQPKQHQRRASTEAISRKEFDFSSETTTLLDSSGQSIGNRKLSRQGSSGTCSSRKNQTKNQTPFRVSNTQSCARRGGVTLRRCSSGTARTTTSSGSTGRSISARDKIILRRVQSFQM